MRSFEGRRIGLALTRSSIPPRKRKRLKKRLLSAISMGGKIDSSILGVYMYIYTYMYVCMYIHRDIHGIFTVVDNPVSSKAITSMEMCLPHRGGNFYFIDNKNSRVS